MDHYNKWKIRKQNGFVRTKISLGSVARQGPGLKYFYFCPLMWVVRYKTKTLLTLTLTMKQYY